ncbi:MAG: DUF2273 domain-containing protein [Eubacteriales bacterium]
MKDFLNKNIGSFIGTAIAIIIGVIFLLVGFWKSMLLILLGVIGFMLGNERIRTAITSSISRLFDSDKE